MDRPTLNAQLRRLRNRSLIAISLWALVTGAAFTLLTYGFVVGPLWLFPAGLVLCLVASAVLVAFTHKEGGKLASLGEVCGEEAVLEEIAKIKGGR